MARGRDRHKPRAWDRPLELVRYVYRHAATSTRRGERLLAVRVIVVG